MNLVNASSRNVRLPMWTSDKNTIPKSISFSGTLNTPGLIICWPKAKLLSSLLFAITPITSSLTNFSASANNSSLLLENNTDMLPVSSSKSTILWPFLLDLISLTIKIMLKLSWESSISATLIGFLSSGLLDNMLYNFSYLLLKYEIRFSSSPLVYDFLLVSWMISKSYSTLDFSKFLLNLIFSSLTVSEASKMASFTCFCLTSLSFFKFSIETGFSTCGVWFSIGFIGVFSTCGVCSVFGLLWFSIGFIGVFSTCGVCFSIGFSGVCCVFCLVWFSISVSWLSFSVIGLPVISSTISPLTDTKSFDVNLSLFNLTISEDAKSIGFSALITLL